MDTILCGWLKWMPVISAAVGACLGALVAYHLSQVNERIKRNRILFSEHINALVQLEHILNQAYGITEDNRIVTNLILKKASVNSRSVLIAWSRPKPLPRDALLATKFQRIEMINELFSYNERIRKFNDDIETICDAYSAMRTALISGNIGSEVYQQAVSEYSGNLTKLLGSYRLMDHRTTELLSRTRAALNLDSKLVDERFLKFPKLTKVTEEHIAAEREQLPLEIEKVRKRSRDENEEFL